jgi:hypothetical protein
MATKSELEAVHAAHLAKAGLVAAATRARSFGRVVDLAVESLDTLPGYADYELRYVKPPTVPLPTLDALLAYAPALFRADAIGAVAEFARAQPRLFKRLGRDHTADLTAASAATDAAVEAWHRVRDTQGGACDPAVAVWNQMGLVADARKPRFHAGWAGGFEGVCPRCGGRRRGDKRAMLAPASCEACGAVGEFVIVRSFATGTGSC